MNKANINNLGNFTHTRAINITKYHLPIADQRLFHLMPRQLQLDPHHPLSIAVIQKDMTLL